MIHGMIWSFKSYMKVNIWRSKKRLFSSLSETIIDKALKDGELRVFIVAGEVSGDSIGSRFMNSLKNLCPIPVRFAGVGGCLMTNQGLNSLFPIEDIAVMGIWELLPHLYKFRVRLKETIVSALCFEPHVVLTIDSKGFSFRFLKQLRARYNEQGVIGPPHFHYVAPSYWAWKGGEKRLEKLSNFIDHFLCILPFEPPVLKSHGVSATFVGHPTLEDVLEFEVKGKTGNHWIIQGKGEEFKKEYKISSGSRIISLLPGSRLQEVTRMLSIFSDTLKLLKCPFPDLVIVVHVAPHQHVEEFITQAVHTWRVPVVVVRGGLTRTKYNAFSASSVALCTSGTVAIELQLARLPCVVAYRAHFLTEWIIRQKAKVSYISLPNILLNSDIIPEALFQECTPSKLASMLTELLSDEDFRKKQIIGANKVMELLTPSVPHIPSIAAASTVLRFQCI